MGHHDDLHIVIRIVGFSSFFFHFIYKCNAFNWPTIDNDMMKTKDNLQIFRIRASDTLQNDKNNNEKMATDLCWNTMTGDMANRTKKPNIADTFSLQWNRESSLTGQMILIQLILLMSMSKRPLVIIRDKFASQNIKSFPCMIFLQFIIVTLEYPMDIEELKNLNGSSLHFARNLLDSSR